LNTAANSEIQNPKLPAQLGVPTDKVEPPSWDEKPNPPPSFPHIADGKKALARNDSPEIHTPPMWKPETPSKQVPIIVEPEPKKSPSKLPESPTRVPSCVVVGSQLRNLALYDANEGTWELSQRKGKLLLIDFWSTYCRPCRDSVPHLKRLQAEY